MFRERAEVGSEPFHIDLGPIQALAKSFFDL
jgi:hypothetical protein